MAWLLNAVNTFLAQGAPMPRIAGTGQRQCRHRQLLHCRAARRQRRQLGWQSHKLRHRFLQN